MKPLTLLTILVFTCNTLFAQSNTLKAYPSADSYRDGNEYDTFNDVSILPGRNGGYEVRGYSNKTNTILRKAYWGIERNDSLWVNNLVILAPNKDYIPRRSGIKYKPKGYELVLFRSRNYLCFSGPRANVKGMYGHRYTADETGSPSAFPRVVNSSVFNPDIERDDAETAPRFNYLYDMAILQPVFLSRGAMEEYYYSAAAKEDTAFRKFIITLAKSKQ